MATQVTVGRPTHGMINPTEASPSMYCVSKGGISRQYTLALHPFSKCVCLCTAYSDVLLTIVSLGHRTKQPSLISIASDVRYPSSVSLMVGLHQNNRII